MLRPPPPTPPIRVALRIADRALRARIAAACDDADFDIAGPGAAGGDADIVLADRPVTTAAPVIALAPGASAETWRCDLRAVVPADIDGATLGAVIAVVAAGLAVMARSNLSAHYDAPFSGAWADGPERADGDEAQAALTPREREVLALLAEGASNKAIAHALAVSIHTAKFHVASLTEKLGASGRLEAVAIAIRSGLVMV
jgi:DNA-binding NarL/FixJ family response regulator